MACDFTSFQQYFSPTCHEDVQVIKCGLPDLGKKKVCVCVCIPILERRSRVAQRYGTIAAHTRRRVSVRVVFAHVQFCRFDKADATADVQ